MGKQKNIIIINGKVIDARSGSHVGHSPSKSMDGVFKPKTTEPRLQTVSVKKTAIPVVAKKPTKATRHSHLAKDVHKRKDKSKTLMRSSVNRPVPVKVSAMAVRVETSDNSVAVISAPTLHTQDRHKRSKSIAKSNLISRFSSSKAEPLVVKRTERIEVRSHPGQSVANSHVSSPLPTEIEMDSSPKLSAEDMFTVALSKATAHEQKPLKHSRAKHKKVKRFGISVRTVNVLASIAAILVLGGFIAYQNLPNISMRMASAKSGVNAGLPSYKPSGFAVSRQIEATPGQVVINFSSNSDDRNFNVSQKASDWNSQTLIDNYVALNDPNYQTASQSNGKTIYLYGNANATWVDGGVWYNISGNSNLSNDQLISLANSF